MAAVMIGVDPHKGSHTAMAVGADEGPLGQVRVRASAAQAERLLAWAAAWPERTWAVEGAGGLGYLLAQELVAAGERVLDVQPKLAARVWLLAAGAVNKNDPNDVRSVAIVALRSAACLPVRPDDHGAVLKIWAKRHRDLSRARTPVACRLHAVLCELVPDPITVTGHDLAFPRLNISGWYSGVAADSEDTLNFVLCTTHGAPAETTAPGRCRRPRPGRRPQNRGTGHRTGHWARRSAG